MGAPAPSPCPLCSGTGGQVLWCDTHLRVVLADEPDWPGFCRVIWNRHVAEMTALDDGDRSHLMRAVFATEHALRRCLAPDKINLASLGNLVPHLHWHVIPRWHDDSHFPAPIWGQPLRQAARRVLPVDLDRLLVDSLRSAIGAGSD